MKQSRQKLTTLKRAAVIAIWVGLSVRPGFAQEPLATGQTTPVQANKNDGDGIGPVPVADDGALQLGLPLQYQNTGLTVIDPNTGLEWEQKNSKNNVQNPANLHDADNLYRWSGDGTQETIWDWLEDVNLENGTGYAGHSDWRIPNIRELASIVHYARKNPAISTTFASTHALDFWSSTKRFGDAVRRWAVSFGLGHLVETDVTIARPVRAVRGGGP